MSKRPLPSGKPFRKGGDRSRPSFLVGMSEGKGQYQVGDFGSFEASFSMGWLAPRTRWPPRALLISLGPYGARLSSLLGRSRPPDPRLGGCPCSYLPQNVGCGFPAAKARKEIRGGSPQLEACLVLSAHSRIQFVFVGKSFDVSWFSKLRMAKLVVEVSPGAAKGRCPLGLRRIERTSDRIFRAQCKSILSR